MAETMRENTQNPESETPVTPIVPRRPGLKVSWLAYFIEASRKGQLAAAADALGITHQALRRNLDQLEAHLGVQLIHYNGKWLQLTPSGEDFLAEAFELFISLQRLNRPEPVLPVQQTRILRLGWTQTWLQRTLVSLCGQIRQVLPEHRLNIQHRPGSRELEQDLLEGQLDLALLWSAPESAHLTGLAGAPSPYVIVSAPQKTRAWDAWSYAVPPAELTALHPWSDELHPRKIQLEADSFYALLDIALSGQCVVYLPECLVRGQLRQQKLAIVADPPVTHTLNPFLSWRAGTVDPDLQRLQQQLAVWGLHG